MVLTIKNFSNPVGPGITATAPTSLVGVAGVRKATLTWTSATGESGVVWTEEILVRKEGSAPMGSMDGTTVTTITTKDTYASTGYEDEGLDDTKTYYYKVFAIYDNGLERGSSDVNVTPQHPASIIIESDLTNSTYESLITDGWTGIQNKNGNYRLNSNGLAPAATTSGKVNLYKDMSTLPYEVDNIVLEGQINCSTGTVFGEYIFCGGVASVDNNNNIGGLTLSCSNDPSYNKSGLFSSPGGNILYVKTFSGVYDVRFTFSFKTGEMTALVTKNGTTELEQNMTIQPSDLENIDIYKQASIKLQYGSSNNNSLKYAKLTINF